MTFPGAFLDEDDMLEKKRLKRQKMGAEDLLQIVHLQASTLEG